MPNIIPPDIAEVLTHSGVATSALTEWMEDVTNAINSQVQSGTGSPEGVVFGDENSLYVDKSAPLLYIKTEDNTNTGWLAV